MNDDLNPAEGLVARSIVGSSPSLLATIDLAIRAAPLNIPVLILGETGTGKELLARLLHGESRRTGQFVPIDCGALPEGLMETLLFGHKRGAFTGAIEHTHGLIAAAHHGTLLLDELSSLSKGAQVKLLRVLETGIVRRVGEAHSAAVGFRLIGTALENLPELVQGGLFRDDLMQRVAGVVLRLHPLRERRADIPALARHFAQRVGLDLDDDAADLLAEQAWPGNVRELKWTVERCALSARSNTVDTHAVQCAIELGLSAAGANGHSDLNGNAALHAACRTHRGDPDLVAQAMGMARSTLYKHLRRAGIRLERFRREASSL
jgi:DNA-binding NtrC family response regulator